MTKNIGIDIENIKEFSKNADFINKCFHKEEIDYCNKFDNPYEHLCMRWAAKESVIKATSEIQQLLFDNIKILNKEKGQPYVELVSTKSINIEKLNTFKILISMSKTKDNAIAIAQLEND